MDMRESLVRWFLRNTTKDRIELDEYSTEDLAAMKVDLEQD